MPQKSQKKGRSIPRRLRCFPQEHFVNGFGRQPAYSLAVTPVEVVQEFPQGIQSSEAPLHAEYHSGAPFYAPDTSTQESEVNLEERGFDDSEIGNEFYPNNLYTGSGPYAQQQSATTPDSSLYDVRVGNTLTTIPTTDPRDVPTICAYDGSPIVNSELPPFMGAVNYVGVGALTSWSGPQSTTAGSSSSTPRGMAENPEQDNYAGESSNVTDWTSWPPPSDAALDSIPMGYWHDGDHYPESGNDPN